MFSIIYRKKIWAYGLVVMTSALHAEGREFESPWAHFPEEIIRQRNVTNQFQYIIPAVSMNYLKSATCQFCREEI